MPAPHNTPHPHLHYPLRCSPPLPPSSFVSLFSFMPFHLTPSSLLQLVYLLLVMPANDLSCRLQFVCTCAFTSTILPHTSSLKIISWLPSSCFLPLSVPLPLELFHGRSCKELFACNGGIGAEPRFRVRSQVAQTRRGSFLSQQLSLIAYIPSDRCLAFTVAAVAARKLK